MYFKNLLKVCGFILMCFFVDFQMNRRERHFYTWINCLIKSNADKELVLRKAYEVEAKVNGLKAAQDTVLVLTKPLFIIKI